jgi:hypothetical protein
MQNQVRDQRLQAAGRARNGLSIPRDLETAEEFDTDCRGAVHHMYYLR